MLKFCFIFIPVLPLNLGSIVRTLYTNSGNITFPENPGEKYQDNSRYVWYLNTSANTNEILIKILKFDVHRVKGYPCYDFLQIEEVNPQFQLFKGCGKIGSRNFKANGNLIRISFVSDNIHAATGFQIQWNVISLKLTTSYPTVSEVFSEETISSINSGKNEHIQVTRTQNAQLPTTLTSSNSLTKNVTNASTGKHDIFSTLKLSKYTPEKLWTSPPKRNISRYITTQFPESSQPMMPDKRLCFKQNKKRCKKLCKGNVKPVMKICKGKRIQKSKCCQQNCKREQCKFRSKDILIGKVLLTTVASFITHLTDRTTEYESTPFTTVSQSTSKEGTFSEHETSDIKQSISYTTTSRGSTNSEYSSSTKTSEMTSLKYLNTTGENVEAHVIYNSTNEELQNISSTFTTGISTEDSLSKNSSSNFITLTASIAVGIGMLEMTLVVIGIIAIKQCKKRSKKVQNIDVDTKEHDQRLSRKSVYSVKNVYEVIPGDEPQQEFDNNPYVDCPDNVYDHTFAPRPHIDNNPNIYSSCSVQLLSFKRNEQ